MSLLYGHGSRRSARDLPCDPRLAPGAGLSSHDVHMIPDLGKHCYVPPRFMRRREGRPESAQVAVLNTQSAWAAETPNSSVASARQRSTRVGCMSFVLSHACTSCTHSSHSPTPSGTPCPGPLRLKRRYCTDTVPGEVHEIPRAMQSSRLVPVCLRTMST